MPTYAWHMWPCLGTGTALFGKEKKMKGESLGRTSSTHFWIKEERKTRRTICSGSASLPSWHKTLPKQERESQAKQRSQIQKQIPFSLSHFYRGERQRIVRISILCVWFGSNLFPLCFCWGNKSLNFAGIFQAPSFVYQKVSKKASRSWQARCQISHGFTKFPWWSAIWMRRHWRDICITFG